MYEIEKTYTFEYGHRLHKMGENHPCSSLHGHSGIAKVWICAESLNDSDMVLDFNDLRFIKQWLDANWDHTTICARDDTVLIEFLEQTKQKHYVLPVEFSQVTSEALAKHLFDQITKILDYITKPVHMGVVVQETANNVARYGQNYTRIKNAHDKKDA